MKLPPEEGEETLDVSWSGGLAPDAQILIYATSDLAFVNDAYSVVLDDLEEGTYPNLHQLSMSYGAGEKTDETGDDMSSSHQMFTAISAFGVSLFASSGDHGSNNDVDNVVQVSYPACDPAVTGVGGTSLFVDPVTGAVTNETAWSAVGAIAGGDDGSTGGGISYYFARPDYQVGASVPAGVKRLVPDVSLTADPNTGCYLVLDGFVDQFGGTSWSSPSWAGLCALINQARATTALQPFTSLNSALYPLLGTPSFRDITKGDNDVYGTGIGYDEVTGIGVPEFANLLKALDSSTPTIVEAAPVLSGATTATATVGVAFTYQIVASNSPTGYVADNLPIGLAVNPTTGLISGAPTVSGTFAVTLSAANTGGTGTQALTLTVAPAPASAKPAVTLVATEPEVTISGGGIGEAVLSIPTALASDLVVYYTVKGSAVNGEDYVHLKGYAKIKAGRTSKPIRIIPQGDLGGASKKVVKLTLATNDAYTVVTTGFAKITINQ